MGINLFILFSSESGCAKSRSLYYIVIRYGMIMLQKIIDGNGIIKEKGEGVRYSCYMGADMFMVPCYFD